MAANVNPASDLDRERRKHAARVTLVALLVFIVVGTVGGFFAWSAYQRHALAELQTKVAAEGGVNPRMNRGRVPSPPVAPPGFLEEMARRAEAKQSVTVQDGFTAWQATPPAQRDAMIDKLLAGPNRAHFQRAVTNAATRPSPGNGPRAEFIAALSRRLAATALPGRPAVAATKPSA